MKMTEKLDRLMEMKGINKAELSRRTGIPYTTIASLYDKGYENIKLANLVKLARFFGVSLEFLSDDSIDFEKGMEEAEIKAISESYIALSRRGRKMVRKLMDEIRVYESAQKEQEPESREPEYIREYLTPAAAGYASPAEGEDYVLIPKDENTPKNADFAVRISGDSMEPYIKDGSRVYVSRMCELTDGDVGIFFVDGDMKCKQYCEDSFGNIYLFSLNRERKDADVVVPASSGITILCFGKVLLPKKPPLPRDFY